MHWRFGGAISLNPVDITVLTNARKNGKKWAHVSPWIAFADKIPPITSIQTYTLLVHHPNTYGSYVHFVQGVMHLANNPKQHYFQHTLKSNSGKLRLISVPDCVLCFHQKWIVKNILSTLPVSEYAKAYRKGIRLVDNAAPHLGKRYLVKLDIRDFFGSICFDKVFRLFSQHFPANVAMLLAKLTTLDNCLPQGAATSPAISNLVLRPIDDSIANYCRENHLTYTRYSDDMIFSSDEKIDAASLIRFTRHVLRSEGFLLNERKTVVLGPGQKHRICGIIANEKLSLDRQYKRKIRQEVYFLQRHPLEEHIRCLQQPKFFRPDGTPDEVYYIYNLYARIQWVLSIQPSDDFREYAKIVKDRIWEMDIDEDYLSLKKAGLL